MKYFKILLLTFISGTLFAQEDPTQSMIIQYGMHDILRVEQAFSGQRHVPI